MADDQCLGDRITRLGNRVRADADRTVQRLEAKRLALREAMPETARVVDLFRETFGPVIVLRAEENGQKVAAKKRLRALGIDDQG